MALTVLLTAVPLTFAEPATEIPCVYIDNADLSPYADEKPEDHLAYSIPDDANYSVSRDYWRDETEDSAYFTIFTRENTYRRYIELTPDDGYRFTSNTTVFLNGSMDNTSAVELRSNGDLRIKSKEIVSGMPWEDDYLFYEDFENFNPKWWVMFDFDFDGICWQSSSDVPAYEGSRCLMDKTPAELDPDFPPQDWLVSHNFRCTDGAELSWYHRSKTESNEKYTVFILPSPWQNLGARQEVWSGTAPAEYEKVTVDISEFAGQDVCIVFLHEGESENKVLCIDLLQVSDASRTDIESISIRRADIYPVIGDTPGDHFNYSPDADKHYTVIDHYWYDETTQTRNIDKFEQGHEYSSCFVFKAHEHCRLSLDTQVSINGNTDLIKVMNSDGTLSVRTKAAAAAAERPVMPGDVDDDIDVTTADAVIILQITIEAIEPNERQKSAADVNANGSITTADATYVLKKAAGII